jgi:hypothetical protein
MVNVWVAGLPLLWIAVKERLVGLIPMSGGVTGGGTTRGVKVARLLVVDSLVAES